MIWLLRKTNNIFSPLLLGCILCLFINAVHAKPRFKSFKLGQKIGQAVELSPKKTASQSQKSTTSLWRLQHPDGRDLNILGSLHMLPDEAYPLPKVITQAINSAQHIVFEYDLSKVQSRAIAMFLKQHGYFKNKKQTLKGVLPVEQYHQVIRHAERIGYPLKNINHTQPWFLALQMQLQSLSQANFAAANGVDNHVYALAKQEKKSVLGLEHQLTPFYALAALPLTEQRLFLQGVVEGKGMTKKELRTLYLAWRHGEHELLAEYLLDDSMPQFTSSMLHQRNKQWASTINHTISKSPNTLVVVGVAHLVGDSNLLDLLAAMDFVVKQY